MTTTVSKRKFKSPRDEIRFLYKALVDASMGKGRTPRSEKIRRRLRELGVAIQ